MKKFLSLLLVSILLMTMVACDDKQNKKTNEESETSSTIDTNTESSADTNSNEEDSTSETETSDVEEIDSAFTWRVQEVERPDDKITLKTVKKQISDGVNIYNTLADSRLMNYSVEELKESLYNQTLISEKYVLGVSYNEETYYEEYADIGLQKRYHYNHSVVGVLKEKAEDSQYFNDFRVTYYGDTNISTGPYTVSVKLNDVEATKENQMDVLSVLQECMPREIAHYLVFAPDDDGKESNNRALEDAKNLYVTFEDDNFIYYLKRELEEADDYNEACVQFTYGVLEEKFSNQYRFYTGDYQSKNDTMKYLPQGFFRPEMGNLNLITEPSSFIDDYFKAGSDTYVATQIRSGWYWSTHTTGDNGIDVYDVRVEAVCGEDGVALLICPSLDIKYSVYEKDGQVIDMDYSMEHFSTTISEDVDMTSSYKKLLADMITQMKMILGDDVDLSALSYDQLKESSDTKREGSTQVVINFGGTEQKVDVSLALKHNSSLSAWRGSFKLYISIFN